MTTHPQGLIRFTIALVLSVLSASQAIAAEVAPIHFVGDFYLNNDQTVTIQVGVADLDKKTFHVTETFDGSTYIAFPLSQQQELKLRELFDWELKDLQKLQCISYSNQPLKELENETLQNNVSTIESIIDVIPIKYHKVLCYGMVNQIRVLNYVPKNTQSNYLHYDFGWGLNTNIKHTQHSTHDYSRRNNKAPQ